jgi:hypothetical protein
VIALAALLKWAAPFTPGQGWALITTPTAHPLAPVSAAVCGRVRPSEALAAPSPTIPGDSPTGSKWSMVDQFGRRHSTHPQRGKGASVPKSRWAQDRRLSAEKEQAGNNDQPS